MSVSSDNKCVALTCSNGSVYEWEIWSSEIKFLKNFKEDNHPDEIGNCIEYSPDGKYLIVGTN